MNEEAVKSHVKLAAANIGLQLWRNNVGACEDKTGRLIRYGLANESAQMNRVIKSSDLIGATPVVIQPHHIGRTFAVFTAFETKHSDWVFSTADDRAVAQLAYINIVREIGGIGYFINDPAQVAAAIREFAN